MHLITKIEDTSCSKSVFTERCSPNITLAPSEAKPTKFDLYEILYLLKNVITD